MSRMGDTQIQILRDAAKDQRCVRCNAKDETVVGCHYTGARRLAYGGGMGRKVHDLVIAHLCGGCHRWMDQLLRAPARVESRDEEDALQDTLKWMHSEEFQHLIILTLIRLYDQGILLVKGERR